MRILVTGATGLIGRHLIYRLQIDGHEVRALARTPKNLPELPEKNIFHWTDDQLPPSEALLDCDAVIHLAGEGIADQRWTEARKKRLWDSRILGTRNLVAALAAIHFDRRPKLLISGSAIGIYGNGEQIQDESSIAGNGFLSDLCVEWERAATESEKFGVRTVLLRTGLVLAREGGVLKKSGPIILGDGKQWMSWVHVEDMVRFILYATQNEEVKGAFNLSAPAPVTNYVFTKAFSRVRKFPFTLTAPSLALKIALGKMSEIVLASQRILPKKTISSGFNFKWVKLEHALQDLIGNSSLIDNQFSARQFIPLNRKDVFPFFGKAENLEVLTPPWLNFHIENKSTPFIENGSLIDYKLNIHGVPVKWRTQISEWNPDKSFVDNQLKGPYKKWHHIHTFEDVPGGTLITDDVTYQIPFWFFGKLLLPLIRKDVSEIFQYRQEKIKDLYSRGSM